MLQEFRQAREGVVAIAMAVGVVPFTVISVIGLDFAVQSVNSGEIAEIARSACSRARSTYFASAPDRDRQDAAQAVLDRLLPLTPLDTTGGSAVASLDSTGISVSIEGQLPSMSFGVAGSGDLSILMPCDGAAASAAGPRIVFFEGFEQPTVVSSGYSRWFIDPYLPNWVRVSGAGIQLSDNTMLNNIDALEGVQYAELSGDRNRGALPGLSRFTTISRTVSLLPGSYRLSYAYHENHRNLAPMSQVINVYLDPDDGTPLMSNLVMSKDDSVGWELQSYDFEVTTPGDFHITFEPRGTFQDYGAYIDSITLERL